jgi:AbrB family looped-hinge helix DNA binding protein
MSKTAVVSSKGQITLPKELRDRYHLKEGSTVLILGTTHGVLIRAGRHSLRGFLKGKVDPELAEKEICSLRSEWTL